MKPLFATLFFLFSILCLPSQTVKGVVFNTTTNAPVQNAHIYFSKNKGVVSDAEGRFKFRYKAKYNTNDSIYVSHIGYLTKAIHISEAAKKGLRVNLEPRPQQLTETVINATNNLKSNITYTKLESLERPLFSFAAGLQGDKIYVVGGESSYRYNPVAIAREYNTSRFIINQPSAVFDVNFNNFLRGMRLAPREKENFSSHLMVYDIPSDTWETRDLKFRKRSGHNLHIYKDDIYVFGGKRPVPTGKKYLDHVIEIYNEDSNSIVIDETNPNQSVNFASFLYNDYLITLGGIKKINKNGSRNYAQEVYLYNLKTGYWYSLGEMPNPKETRGVLINDKIYLIGGYNGRPLTSIESFDLITGEWKNEGNLFNGMERPGLTHHNRMIYIYDKGKIVTYNTRTGILNEYKIKLNLEYAELFYRDGMLYILGGFSQDIYSSEPSNSLYKINIDEFYTTKINTSKKIKWLEQGS